MCIYTFRASLSEYTAGARNQKGEKLCAPTKKFIFFLQNPSRMH